MHVTFEFGRSDGTRSVRPTIAATAFDRRFGSGFIFQVRGQTDSQHGKAGDSQDDSNFVESFGVHDFESDYREFPGDS